jgi:very-short-patch-repair endonuclease
MLLYNPNLKTPARLLRKTMTDAERQLWHRLRDKQVMGIQFYRQKPIGAYIVDFHAPAVQLVIEVDGAQHLEDEHRQKDHERDAYLEAQGLHVLRFDNLQVLQQTEAVVERIFDVVKERLNP